MRKSDRDLITPIGIRECSASFRQLDALFDPKTIKEPLYW